MNEIQIGPIKVFPLDLNRLEKQRHKIELQTLVSNDSNANLFSLRKVHRCNSTFHEKAHISISAQLLLAFNIAHYETTGSHNSVEISIKLFMYPYERDLITTGIFTPC